MKRFAVLAFVAMEASLAHFVTLAEAMKKRRNPESMNGFLMMSQMMASGQEAMAQAEGQREKAVTMLRSAAAENFDRTAAFLGDAIAKYEAELVSREFALEAAVNASAIGLAKNARKPGELDFAKNHQRSKLKVEIESAKQQVAHGRLQDEVAARQAMEAAKGAIEAEAVQMARKLGSMKPELQHAEQILQQHIVAGTEALIHPPANASATSMDSILNELRATEAATSKDVKNARKELQQAVAKSGADLQSKDRRIMENLDSKDPKNLNAVLGKVSESRAARFAKALESHAAQLRGKALDRKVAQLHRKQVESKAAELHAKLNLPRGASN